MLIDGVTLSSGANIKLEDGSKYINNPIYDIAGCTFSKPEANAVLMRFSVTRPFKILQGFPESFAESTVAATGSPVYAIIRDRNGTKVNIGKITFTGMQAVFADGDETTDHTFQKGDILTVVAPATPDSTHDAIAWTIAGLLV